MNTEIKLQITACIIWVIYLIKSKDLVADLLALSCFLCLTSSISIMEMRKEKNKYKR